MVKKTDFDPVKIGFGFACHNIMGLEATYLMQYTHHAPMENIQKFAFKNLDDTIRTLSAMLFL